MNTTGKIFFYSSVLILCCSALFLLLLTVSGFFWGIHAVFLDEPELNGAASPENTRRLMVEGCIFCLWLLGAGAGFIANITALYRMIRIYHAKEK